ncbi:MAG: pyruvate kinase [Candidatus Micrarchaeia archaeon]
MQKPHSRKTKIVCTIGPATESLEGIRKLADAGMNVARINLSHGSIKTHEQKLSNIRTVNESRRDKVAVLLDTRGPEIRTGKAPVKVQLVEGAGIDVTSDGAESSNEKISLNYANLSKIVAPGSSIFLSDGNIELEVVEVQKKAVRCKVKVGGELGSNKNVCIPGADLDLPTLGKEDLSDIKEGARWGIDFVAQSFVRGPEDVLELMDVLQAAGSDAHMIAKIELASAFEQVDRIIAAADGLMVARGDLGVQVPIEQIPAMQKKMVQKCNAVGKPVIVATHMLESMTVNPRPTRAEATDVANAVFDGVDAVMLSGETAAGRYPIKSVEMMARICVEAEKSKVSHALSQPDSFVKPSMGYAISRSACGISDDLDADSIIVPTTGGFTARLVAQQRPGAEIIALTPDVRVVNKLALVRGVHALLFKAKVQSEDTMQQAIGAAHKSGLVKDGDLVVVTGGIPLGLTGSTNTIHVQRVGRSADLQGQTKLTKSG